MKDEKRRGDARRLAEEYAPRPISSYLMYGIVGVSLAGLGLYAFANFYGVDPLAYPLWVALAVGAVFAWLDRLANGADTPTPRCAPPRIQ